MTPRIIANKAKERGDFIPLEDGYYTWWPRGLGGAMNAASLRELADELDRMNAAWDAQVSKDLEGTSLCFPYGPFNKGSGES